MITTIAEFREVRADEGPARRMALSMRDGGRSARVDQVAEKIRRRISAGKWATLPKVVALSRLLGTGTQTVTAALRQLAAEGVVTKALVGAGPPRWVVAGSVADDRALPPVERVARAIREHIASGELVELTSVVDLAEMFEVGRGTVRRALHLLANDGLVVKDFSVNRQGRWTLRESQVHRPSAVERVTAELRHRIERGEWKQELPVVRALCELLDTSTQTAVAALRRLAAGGVVVKAYLGSGPRRWVIATAMSEELALSAAARVTRAVRERIENGAFTELPRVKELAATYQTAPGTVQAALDQLADDGLVVKDHAMGGHGRWTLRDRPVRRTTAADRATVELRDRITRGEWQRLPTVRALCKLLKTSNEAVTAALWRLAAEGLVRKGPRSGTGTSPGWMLAGVADPPPRWHAVAEEIWRRIVSGEWAELPPLTEIGLALGAGGRPVNRAIRLLADAGRIVKVPVPRAPHRWVVARDDTMAEGSRQPGADRWIGWSAARLAAEIRRRIAHGEWTALPSAARAAELFGCAPGTVLRAYRILRVDGITAVQALPGPPRWVLVTRGKPAGGERSFAVANELDRRIRSGELATWPGVARMAEEFHVADSTLTTALHELARRGVMDKAQGRWVITLPRCRRAACARPIVGRGLCGEHYARWQAGEDLLSLPDDTAPAPGRARWRPPSR